MRPEDCWQMLSEAARSVFNRLCDDTPLTDQDKYIIDRNLELINSLGRVASVIIAPDEPEFTVQQLAKKMCVSDDTINTMVGNGDFGTASDGGAYKVGRQWRIPRAAFEAYKARNSVRLTKLKTPTARNGKNSGYRYSPGDKVV